MKQQWWMGGLAAIALFVAMLATAAFQPLSAFAADPPQPGQAPAGQVDRVAGAVLSTGQQSFVLQTLKSDTVQVHTTDQTTCRFLDGSGRSACSEIAAGDHAVAAGRRSGNSDQFQADRVVVNPPVVSGEVTAVSGSTLSVQTKSGNGVSVAYDGSTTCKEDRQPIDCSTIAVGNRIVAAGDPSAATSGGTLLAKRIAVLRQRVAGTVTAVDGSTLTLQTRDGATASVALLATTQCFENTQPVDCSTIAVGNHVGAVGFVVGGVLQAQKVLTVTKLPAVHGVVQSANGRQLEVQAPDGTTYHVHWGDETQCTNAAGPVDCGSIAARDRVAVRGADLGGDNVQAKRIVVRRAPAPRATSSAPVE
jgi:hypothetical protein